MHTDEYEISLLRELNVCREKVSGLRRALSIREKEHGIASDRLAEEFGSGRLAADKEYVASWLRDCESLVTWEDRMTQYESALRMMRI